MKEVENKLVVRIPRPDKDIDALTKKVADMINAGENPFHSAKMNITLFSDELSDVSIFDLGVNRMRYEGKIYDDASFPGKYEYKDEYSFWESALSNRYAEDRDFLSRFYVEIDGKKENIYDKMDKILNSGSTENLTIRYVLHAITQSNVKVTLVNSDGSEVVLNNLKMTEAELEKAKRRVDDQKEKLDSLIKHYTNYSLKGKYEKFSKDDLFADPKNYTDPKFLDNATDVFKKDFKKLEEYSDDYQAGLYEYMMVHGVPGYPDGISVKDYAKKLIGEVKETLPAKEPTESEMARLIVVHAAANPKIDISFIPRVYDYTKTPVYSKGRPKECGIFIGGKYGIETGPVREAIRLNTGINTVINKINDTDITEIHDLALTSKRNKHFWVSGNYPLPDGPNVTKESIEEAAAKFDEIFKDALNEDKDFISKLQICPEGKEGKSIDEMYKKAASPKSFDSYKAIEAIRDETKAKKAFVIHALCEEYELRYVNGIYSKKINNVKPSIKKRAKENLDKFDSDFKKKLGDLWVYKAKINSKDRFNKRIIPEELSKQELDEAAKSFDDIFKLTAKNLKVKPEELLKKMEFRADTDVQYENPLSYVDSIYVGENLSMEQRILYAKVFIVHALGDPREEVRFRRDMLHPDTNEVMNVLSEEEKYVYSGKRDVPKDYRPKEIKRKKKAEHKRADDEKLFEKSKKLNEEQRKKEDEYNFRKTVFNDIEEALDLISSVNDAPANSASVNQGEKAGKLMDSTELLGLSEAELTDAEKAFDETFKDLIAYDNKVKSQRFYQPTTDYTKENDLFVSGFELGDKEKFNKVKYEVMTALADKHHYTLDQMDIRNKYLERYMKAFILRAVTCKDESLIYNPMVRESFGLNNISRYNWEDYDYLAKFMDINHPVKANLKDVYDPEYKYERKGVEAKEDEKENDELERLREESFIAKDERLKDERRPFKDSEKVNNGTIAESEEEDLQDDEWEEKQEEKRRSEEEERKALEEKRKAEEEAKREYDLTHDFFGNELPPEEVSFNRRQYQIMHSDMEYEEMSKALIDLEKERAAYRKKKIEERKRPGREEEREEPERVVPPVNNQGQVNNQGVNINNPDDEEDIINVDEAVNNQSPVDGNIQQQGQQQPPVDDNIQQQGQQQPPVGDNLQQQGQQQPPVDDNIQQQGQQKPPVDGNIQQQGQQQPPVDGNIQQQGQQQPPVDDKVQQPLDPVEALLAAHTEPFGLKHFYNYIVGFEASLFPDFKDELKNLFEETAQLYANMQNSEHPYDYTMLPGDGAAEMFIKHPDDKRAIAEKLIKFTDIIGRMKEVYTDISSPKRQIIDLFDTQMKCYMSNDYQRIIKADPDFEGVFRSTFNTFPSNEFGEFLDEKGMPVYTVDNARFAKVIKKYPFLDQLKDRQDFMLSTYLPYMKKKEAGNVTDKEAEDFRLRYRAFQDKQKQYMEKLNSISNKDKDIAENRTAITNVSFYNNWKVRFSDGILKSVDTFDKYTDKGWPEADVSLLEEVRMMKRRLQIAVSKTVSDKMDADDSLKALDILTEMNKAYDKLFSADIKTPEIRLELLQNIKPFVDRYTEWQKAVQKDNNASRNIVDHPIKSMMDAAIARNVTATEVGKSLQREEETFGSFTLEEGLESLKKAYLDAATMEERYNFLVDFGEYLSVNDKNGRNMDEYSRLHDQMFDDFADRYVNKASQPMRENLLRLFGRSVAANDLAIAKEKEEVLKQYPEFKKEGKAGELKAYYIAESRISGRERMISNSGVQYVVNMSFDEGQPERDMLKKINITADSTMEDFAKLAGCNTDDEIKGYLDGLSLKPSAEMNVVAYFKAHLKSIGRDVSDEEALNMAKSQAVGNYRKNQTATGANYVLNKENMTDELRDSYKYVASKSSGGGIDYSEISEWIDNEGRQYVYGDNEKNLVRVSNSFFKKYLKDYKKEKALEETAERLSGQKIKTAYSDYLTLGANGNYVDNNISYDKKMAIVRSLDIDAREDTMKIIAKQSRAMRVAENSEVYHTALNGTRTPGLNNVYTLWVVGTHPELDINEFMRFEEYPELVDEFIKFCAENPLNPAKSEENHVESVGKWAEILKKSTDRFKDLKMPDIDYSDPEKIKENMQFLMKLRGLSIDFSQEKDKILCDGFGRDGKKIAADKLGTQSFNDMNDFWSGIQNLMAPFNSGYAMLTAILGNSRSSSSTMDNIYTYAVSRALMGSTLKEAPGRSLNNMIKLSGTKALIYQQLTTGITTMSDEGVQLKKYASIEKISREDVFKYLRGENKEKFERKVQKIAEAVTPYYMKEEMVDACATGGKAFVDYLDFGNVRETLINLPDNADAIKDFLKSDAKVEGLGANNDETRLRTEWLNKNMRLLFSENVSLLMSTSKIKRSDMFIIDGKSVSQLWGAKYADLTEKEREECYQLEVMKRIAEGSSEIKFKTLSYEGTKAKMSGTVTLFKPNAVMQQMANNYRIYKEGAKGIKNFLKELQNTLLQTHENKNLNKARREIGEVGSELFQNMESTLDEAIKAFDDTDSTVDGIEEKLREFNKAAATYYKERKNLIFNKRSAEGQTRLDTSERAKNEMPDIISYYHELAKGVKSDLIYTEKNTFNNIDLRQLENAFTDEFLQPRRKDNYRIDGVIISEADAGKMASTVKTRAHEKLNFYNMLKTGLKGLGKDYDKLMGIESAEKVDSYDMALAHLLKNAVEEVEKDGLSIIQVKGVSRGVKDKFDDGSFKREAEKLSKNPVFLATYKQNRKGFHEEWNRIEKRTDTMLKHMRDSLNEQTEANPDLAEYIVNGNGAPAANQNQEQLLRERYQRLGLYITKKILTEPSNRVIVQAIESERMEFGEVQNKVIESLIRKHVLDGRNFRMEDFRTKLANGSIQRLATESVLKQAGKDAADRLPKSRRMAPTEDIKGPRINN